MSCANRRRLVAACDYRGRAWAARRLRGGAPRAPWQRGTSDSTALQGAGAPEARPRLLEALQAIAAASGRSPDRCPGCRRIQEARDDPIHAEASAAFVGTQRPDPLAKRGLQRAKLTTQPVAYGRYEADRPNELWVGDVLVGPWVPHPRGAGSKRARLFLLVDDHSRLLLHGRWVFEENARWAQSVLRAAIARRGLPETLYLDYADPRIMPTLAENTLHRLEDGLRMSA